MNVAVPLARLTCSKPAGIAMEEWMMRSTPLLMPDRGWNGCHAMQTIWAAGELRKHERKAAAQRASVIAAAQELLQSQGRQQQ
jgi:hypothetical protein